MGKTRYTIGEVCQLLKVKPHVLRYWENEIPFFSPHKDLSGWREYTQQDLDLLYRVKYLLYERKYTLSGAREQLWRECTSSSADYKARIAETRATLLHLLQQCRGRGE